jgi:hypothetical protein
VGSGYNGGSVPGAVNDIVDTTYRDRYEEPDATGVIRIGPTFRDTRRRGDTAEIFIVPVWIEEQWVSK